jgi:hypothetical protein
VQGDENKAMFAKYFGHIKTANFAIAGDTTQGVLGACATAKARAFSRRP